MIVSGAEGEYREKKLKVGLMGVTELHVVCLNKDEQALTEICNNVTIPLDGRRQIDGYTALEICLTGRWSRGAELLLDTNREIGIHNSHDYPPHDIGEFLQVDGIFTVDADIVDRILDKGGFSDDYRINVYNGGIAT